MMVIGLLILLKVMEYKLGQTSAAIKEIGKTVSITETENSLGRMENNTLDNFSMTKNTGMEFMNGQMEETTKDSGTLVSNMGVGYYNHQLA